ncbi:MAG: hypothetical protein IJ589_02350 [Lachnospiraceae bacterium]|nr:hypothetical protein [Lachnospiraceae bacterium]
MNRRRSSPLFLWPKKFYRPKELLEILPMNEKHLLQNAMLCGALYRISNKKLINLEIMLEFVNKVGNLAGEIGGKYCQVKDAAAYLGLNEDQTMQIASDAGALFKVRQLLLVDKEVLRKYVEQFKFKVTVLDIEEVEENERIERRLKHYV